MSDLTELVGALRLHKAEIYQSSADAIDCLTAERDVAQALQVANERGWQETFARLENELSDTRRERDAARLQLARFQAECLLDNVPDTWCGCGDRIMPGAVDARCGTCAALDQSNWRLDVERLEALIDPLRKMFAPIPDEHLVAAVERDEARALGGEK